MRGGAWLPHIVHRADNNVYRSAYPRVLGTVKKSEGGFYTTGIDRRPEDGQGE